DEIQLKEETEHARSYAAIQSARFSSRIKIEFGELPEEWKSFMVPRLILQPLLENSFKYGLEDRMEDGLLHVSFTPNENGLKITVEDNGQSDSDPEAMQSALETQEIDIVSGMINIHRRLKIYFHGESGLKISRSELGGIAVSMNLPGREETK
ncbi:MAG: two-component sensor histidine kinase, partial [Clostridia bacterium]|nr:two-component sensor histidine kinase [Clostridia bacterium]MBQ4452144.1 two-component sensor histidine kinase [Clostridia bacterium]